AAAAVAAPAAAPLAARIDGAPLYAATVDTLWLQRRASEPSLTRRAVLDDLIDARLLSARAGAAAPRAQATVAYTPDVVVEERLAAALNEVHGKEIAAAIKALPRASLESLVIAQAPMPKPRLDAIFSRSGAMLLEIALSEEQQAQAAKLEVLRYQLPGAKPASITLLDVYRRQNVQGRLALSQQAAGVATRQARHILGNAFVMHWASQRFGAGALADLRKAIADSEKLAALQQQYGVGMDTDAGSPVLNRLAQETSAEEIEKYYQQHQDQFTRMERVRARHIRLSDEAEAQRAVKALQGGASFAATARSMSRAADAARGGDLGWISADGSKDWLASLAFSQEPGKASAAIRAPVGPNEPGYWEIVLVEEREQGVHPPGSETVRYQACRMIALQKATQQLGEMKEQARRSARIDILEAQ
ncbi:hypothetical protein GM658_16185, partial [Pseudoduganella eburnea]